MIAAYCILSTTPSVAGSNVFDVAFADAENQCSGVFKISLPEGRKLTDQDVEVCLGLRIHTTLLDTALLAQLMSVAMRNKELARARWPHSALRARLEKLLAESLDSNTAQA
jgi:hypothetical protein